MHHPKLGEVVNSSQQNFHVVLDVYEWQLFQIRQKRLRCLVFEDKGDLPFQSVALNKVSNKLFAIQQFEDQHLDQNVCRVNCWENSLDSVLPLFSIGVLIVLISSTRFKHNTV